MGIPRLAMMLNYMYSGILSIQVIRRHRIRPRPLGGRAGVRGASLNFQKTLKKAVTLNGIGLHSGQAARVTLNPGKPNQGLVFMRSDMEGQPRIPAHFKNVISE